VNLSFYLWGASPVLQGGKCFLDMLGVRSERQLEGIARAKAKGTVYKGRKPSIDRSRMANLKTQGLGATAIANQLKIDRTSIYRILKESGEA
jgi:DNA invertase Pin-like site-specific DNA recombinase